MGKFIIVGGGPTGLMTAIFSNQFLQIPNLKIQIYDNRFNTVGRLRQVINDEIVIKRVTVRP